MPTVKRWVRERSQPEATIEERIVGQLAEEEYSVGGKMVSGDQLFMDMAISFRETVSESSLAFHLKIRARNGYQPPREPQSIEAIVDATDRVPNATAKKILDDWYELGMLNPTRATIAGAPDASGNYTSIHSLPQAFTVYTLNTTGIAVLAYLKRHQ
jgi:hypothetical protein